MGALARGLAPASYTTTGGTTGQRSDDQLAGFHLKRLLNGATGTTVELD